MKIKTDVLKTKNEQGQWISLPTLKGENAVLTKDGIISALGYTPAEASAAEKMELINTGGAMTKSDLMALDKGVYVLEKPITLSLDETTSADINGFIRITKDGNNTVLYCMSDGKKYKLSSSGVEQLTADESEKLGASYLTPFNSNSDVKQDLKNLELGEYIVRISGSL